MEAHKLRLVRCPKCYQLLVEYPSIPVYKCGCCGTILRAKKQVVPAVQANSVSDEQSNFPNGHKESPQDNKLICSDEQKITSSADKPHENVSDGIVSSLVNSTNSPKDKIEEDSMSVAENVATVEYQKEETCFLGDKNCQNPGITVNEMSEKGTEADFGSNLIEGSESLYTSENANTGNVEKVDISEMSTPYKETEVVQAEDRPHVEECMHVESHEALIEELERSLSFSSDYDEYFSDEAEISGLSDALRHQMGSRRFMLGSKMNDASRDDPHGRLIEELEMSFTDAEETMVHHAMVADRIHENKHDMHLPKLGPENAHPCEESMPSLDNTHLESDKYFQQENTSIDNCNEGKKDIQDDNSSASDVHGNEQMTVANEINEERHVEDEDGANYIQENKHHKHLPKLGPESAHPCEESIPSPDYTHLESEEYFQQENKPIDNGNEGKKDIQDGNSSASDVHGNEHMTVVNDINEERHVEDEDGANYIHENKYDKHLPKLGPESAHPCEESIPSLDNAYLESEEYFQQENKPIDNGNEGKKDIQDENNSASDVHGNEHMTVANEINEERRVEDEDGANYIHLEENVAVVEEHIAKGIDKNEHSKDQHSLGAEFLITEHVKSEVIFQQEDLLTHGIQQKVGDVTEDVDTTNSVQKDVATVLDFSRWSNKRNQCRLPSFNKDKEQVPYKYRVNKARQGLSLDAEDFRSIQHFIESQLDGTSSSVSDGSPSQGSLVHRTSNNFNNIVRNERLKKMDELRDQLSRLSSQKGIEKRYQKRGLEYQQQSNSYDVEQNLQSVGVDSIPSSCAHSYYRHERPPRYQPSNHFSSTQTYPHCQFGHVQANIPYNYDTWEFNSYYQSSYAESTVPDHDSLMSSYKEPKRVARKHILRPLSGASPFSICSTCFNLIQLPSDIYISKAKICKMQCGKCAKVLVLSFRAEGKISKEVEQQLNKSASSVIAKNKDATSHSAECLRGPVSINEEYGASVTRSFSVQAGASLAATQSCKTVSYSALYRLMGYDSASQLLRHSRPLDDGYDSFESMVPVSSRVSRRKNR